ncbi:TIGR02646 family protein [Pseudomonas syringae pv. actinidifoliorum]|nr:TIGR02646 family protein [Pseudomonas syringae pv. actinidifoliorum]MDU8522713.1 TIGR02646 family protein [Pseudomonas syringae pv. actinidifoliorum]MDU8528189.1 TIGR02646 family protein [Pseudomonas syringae pv. actinidifoliorum]
MRKIEKGSLAVLEKWKRANKGKKYADLVGREDIKDAIRHACVTEQHGLCAYCCCRITAEKDSACNEHVEAQHQAPNRTLDFGNIVASCTKAKRCDNAHGHQRLPLTPLMIECEEELQFELSGLVVGTTPRARECIKVLNLGDTRKFNKGLIEERKSMIDDLLYSKGVNPAEFIVEEDGMLDLLIEDMLRVNVQGELQAFSPVLVNVIRRLKALRVS